MYFYPLKMVDYKILVFVKKKIILFWNLKNKY